MTDLAALLLCALSCCNEFEYTDAEAVKLLKASCAYELKSDEFEVIRESDNIVQAKFPPNWRHLLKTKSTTRQKPP